MRLNERPKKNKKTNTNTSERNKLWMCGVVAAHVFVPILRRHVIQLNAQQSERIKAENKIKTTRLVHRVRTCYATNVDFQHFVLLQKTLRR